MSGTINNRSYNYGHGIVSQDCLAREYSEAGLEIKLVCSGTFVQVHSIREDEVMFCIVRDDMEVEVNKMVCKKADIINVPENLWGPLFTVKKMARLSLVKDSKVAESIGNISVGHTVQVLGPDSSVICTANVTFRNSIGRLGVGVYFGLQVLSSRENLQTIIEKVSLLGPGTKGFPRGCDIVVTVDKILPSNYNFSKEKSTCYYDKECKKQLVKSFSSGDDINSGNYKSVITYNLRDKHSNNCKKDERASRPDSEANLNHSRPSKIMNSDNQLNVGDEVVYLHGDIPEKGLVRWIGFLENSLKVEVEFDKPICTGTGTADGSGEFFRPKYQHTLIVPPMALIKLSDYLVNTSKEKFHLRKNANINNNNNNSSNNNNNYNNNLNANNILKTNININGSSNSNNINNNNNSNGNGNNINNNGDCCSSHEFSHDPKQDIEDGYKKSKNVSVLHQCLKNPEKNFETNDCFPAGNREEVFDGKGSFKGGHAADGSFECGSQPASESFDFGEPIERKTNYKRNCDPVDNGLAKKETNRCPNLQNPKRAPYSNRPGHDLYDPAGPERERCHRVHFCTGKKSQKSHGGDDDLAFYESSGAHSSEKNSRTFYDKGSARNVTENVGTTARFERFSEMTGRNFDNSYIPVTVVEQSILAKKCSRAAALNAEEPYDVPPSAIRRVPGAEESSSCLRGPHPQPPRNPRDQAFYLENRDALPSAAFKYGFDDVTNLRRDAWSSRHSEHSSSEENLANYCGRSKPSHSAGFLSEELGKGSVVELTLKGEPHFGVIRWIGTLPEERDDCPPRLIAGIEMEEEYAGFTDGTFNNKRYFQCNPKKALFVPLSECRKDSRFLDESQKQSLSPKINYGQIDCPVVEGTIPPINRKGDIESICGKNRGIQGHHNSCYLDATLFSMFAFTSVFDSLLYRPPTKNDIPQYSEVQRVLREEIVNPLRKNLYVRADRVMKLRTLLEKLSSVSGLTSEEKDPEEFLNSLLAQILKAEPFLKLSSGQEAFHYQLFVEKDERLVLPSVQQLFEQSFLTSDIKLKQVPSCLIIQMPRFGKSFKMYSKILPPQLLDITDIIENSPRQCTVCGKLAEYECKDCFGQQAMGNGLECISFCKICLDTVHNHHCRNKHNSRALTVPVEFYELQEHCIIPRLYMELFAVVCIETSHYVAFVKCGSGSDAPWCFFDSMADRKGEQNGYNIPEMVPCPDLPYWLSEDGAKMLNEMRDERQLTEHAKRLFSDAYMCMYQSPDLMMYR